ncbi:MAG: four helix bundle protein, partial [bacterium]|nr:four helix bundle protein [bacterium]
GKYNFGEKIHSFQIARGEAYEIRSQIASARDKKYLEVKTASDLESLYTSLIKGISSYINFLRRSKEA